MTAKIEVMFTLALLIGFCLCLTNCTPAPSSPIASSPVPIFTEQSTATAMLTSTPAPLPTPTRFASPTVASRVSVTRSHSPSPTATATSVVALDTPAEIACSDVAPFAPACLDQPRPSELASDVEFIGILPAGPVTVAAWSPDGTRLAYAVTNAEADGFQGLEVRSLPNFGLEGRWPVQGIITDLTWTPDGQTVLFVFDRGEASSIGLACLGKANWRDLLPGEKAVLAVSQGKNFVDWLGETIFAFRVHCGTGCETLYTLDIATGDLRPLVNAQDSPDTPYADVFATVYLFSPDHCWLATTSWGAGVPQAVVLEWPGPLEPFDLSASLDTSYTEAQSWTDGSLAFIAYSPGMADDWSSPPRSDLYIWNADTRAISEVASGAFRALFAPTGDRLAILFVGESWVHEEGLVESDDSVPHLGLLNWPEARVLAVQSVSAEGASDVFDLWRLPTPVWSPHGDALAFHPAGGGLTLMGRDGNERPVLTGKATNWTGWGAEGNLALLVGDDIWLLRALAWK